MSEPIGRVPRTSGTVNPQSVEAVESAGLKGSGKALDTTFIEYLSQTLGTYGSPKLAARSLHIAARRELFQNLVTNQLDNPNHPYYNLVPQGIRQDMISAITEELVHSHYLT